MQLGFIGLGKMGGNMVHRIHRDSDHECVVFDFSEDAVKEAEGHGASGVSSLEQMVEQLERPRAVWVMVPAGDPTEQTVMTLAELMDEGDMIIDGGNTRWPIGTSHRDSRPSSWVTTPLPRSTSLPNRRHVPRSASPSSTIRCRPALRRMSSSIS